MPENFKPFKHYSPNSIKHRFLLLIRLILDFQFLTIYSKLIKILPLVNGRVLDIGCGNSPFRHLLNKERTKYTGLDYKNSENFNYKRNDVVYFDGDHFPFEDNYFDFLLCTEVLEHIQEPRPFIEEAFRVLKSGGKAIYTIPWSARFHYIPFDYYRYTPTMLSELFKKFKIIEIENRGTDVTVISSKIIVLFGRVILNIFNKKSFFLLYIMKILYKLIFLILSSPILILAIISGQISFFLKIGSPDDCLGYTLILEK